MALTPQPESTAWPAVEAVDPLAVVPVAPVATWYSATKTFLDWTAAVVLLVPGLPVIAVCWALVKLTSPGPGFYLQSRMGRGGREYAIIKLRTMTHNVELKTGGAVWSTKGDNRITKFGAFLRKTHLDELPQLFNVLMLQMSLVGPRPERKTIVDKLDLEKKVPGYGHRLLVKPGVTGLAQIQLPADEDVNSVKHKVVYDLYYIENYSVWLDLRVLVATAFKAAGMKPRWLRRLFFLPHRDTVAEVFYSKITPAVEPAPNFQPV